jgi:hypothetical protein
MKRVILLILLSCSLECAIAAVYQKAEIAICADLSYSTKGFLEGLRTNMWYLMNHLSVYEPQPTVKMGMVCYGKTGYGSENNYTRMLSDLTAQINIIQEELYSTVNGEPARESFPEAALMKTIDDLSWSKDANTYKTIFFMGNGMLHDRYFDDIVKSAQKKGIVLHVMYYRTYHNQDEIVSWTALCHELNIDLQYIEPAVIMPLGREIKSDNTEMVLEANSKLNNTYIPYGEHGVRDFNKYLELDQWAKQTDIHCQEFRFMYKISNSNAGANKGWDLVDLSLSGELDTNTIEKKFLPEMYRNLSFTDLLKVVDRKKEEREYLREIANITARRNVTLTHDYYQEYKGIIGKSLYILVMQNINADIDNVHLIMD